MMRSPAVVPAADAPALERSAGRGLRGRLGEDDGSILPLVAVYVAIALALVLVATAATRLYLERVRLQSLADGAALAAAESFDLTTARFDGITVQASLDDDAVAAAARRYLAEADAVDVALLDATTPDGRDARVRLQERWRPPLLAGFLPDGVAITVEASARTAFW